MTKPSEDFRETLRLGSVFAGKALIYATVIIAIFRWLH